MTAELSRALGLVVAVVLLAIVAVGGIAFGLLLLVAGSVVELGDIAGAALLVVAGLIVGYGAVAAIAAVGLWRWRAWGWALGLGVGLVGLLGVGVAALYDSFQAPLLVAVLLCGGTVVALLPASVRRSVSIG